MRKVPFILAVAVAVPFGIYCIYYTLTHPDLTQTRIMINLLPWSILVPLVAVGLMALAVSGDR